MTHTHTHTHTHTQRERERERETDGQTDMLYANTQTEHISETRKNLSKCIHMDCC